MTTINSNNQPKVTLKELKAMKESPDVTPLQPSSNQASEQPQAQVAREILNQSSKQKDQGSSTAPKGSASSATTPKGREGDFYKFFKDRFGPLIVLILWAAMADLDKASFYAPSPEECEELAPHAARLFVRIEDALHLPKWAHSALTNSDDVISIGLLVVGYLDRIGVLKNIMPYFLNAAKPKVNVNGYQQNNGSVQQGRNDNTGPIPFGVGYQHFEPI
jgi:hypothetical protein